MQTKHKHNFELNNAKLKISQLDYKRRQSENRKRQRQWNKSSYPSFVPSGQFAPVPVGQTPAPLSNPKQACSDLRMQSMKFSSGSANKDAAEKLKAMLVRYYKSQFRNYC